MLLGNYPNTYTFTKSLAERAMHKLHGDLPTCIIRPSIIIACYQSPFQGWIDTLSAGGGITYGIQVGMLHYVYASLSATVDLVPCDFTANAILAQIVYQNRIEPGRKFQIFHSSTGNKNPLKIWLFRRLCLEYANFYPYFKKLGPAFAYGIGNKYAFKVAITASERVPLKVLETYSKLPVVGNKKMRDQIKFASTISDKMFNMQSIFHHFITNSWVFETEQSAKLTDSLCPEERKIFYVDVNLIDWRKAIYAFSYGLRRFFMREDAIAPEKNLVQILSKNAPSLFEDITRARDTSRYVQPKDNIIYF